MKLLMLSMLASLFAFADPLCEGYGPQTPRDITDLNGTNAVVFDTAPNYQRMNLCNIYFHKGAELGSCLSDKCANPQLRVEAEVFKVVNDRNVIQS